MIFSSEHMIHPNKSSQECLVSLMAWTGDPVPKIMFQCHLKRTNQKDPRAIGTDVLRCTAHELEGAGVENVIKKVMDPKHGLRLTELTTDGDQNAKKFTEKGVWQHNDNVPADYIDKKICCYIF